MPNLVSKIFILIMSGLLLHSTVLAKAICFGKVTAAGKCPGWRYMDSDFYGKTKTIDAKDSKGKITKVAVLAPALRKSRFLLLTGYFGAEPKVNQDIGIRIIYKISNAKKPLTLMAQLSYAAKGFKRGKISQSIQLPKGKELGNDWYVIKIPVSAFNLAVNTPIKRVWLFPEYQVNISEQVKLFVKEISVIKEKDLKYISPNKQNDQKTSSIVKKGKRYCAIFPKPYWYTDKTTFYAPQVYKMLYEDGFNVIGVPGSSPTFVKPVDLAKRVKRFVATGKALAKYPGMYVYPKMTMCWSYPVDANDKYSKVVWFNGYEANLACPVDDDYWHERIIPYFLAYARASKQTPTFAIMLDWEIYVKNKFRGVYGLCYCDKCWKNFQKETKITLPALSFKERNKWLIKNNLRLKYSNIFYKHLRQLGSELRKQTDKINPKLSYWFLPSMNGTFLTELGRALASKQAPIIVINEDTYGKPSLALSDTAGVKSIVKMVKTDLHYLQQTGIPFKYLTAIMPNQNPAFHGRQAIETAKLCDGIWIWELGKASQYKHGRRKVMNILKQANKEIRGGTFKIPASWQQEKQISVNKIPTGKTGIAISGLNSNIIKLPNNAYPYELQKISLKHLQNAKLVILQNFNAKLSASSPTVKILREYVKDGGNLLLIHDTGYFMDSPFPEIVKGYFIPKEQGDGRHILDSEIKISNPCIPAPFLAGKAYKTSFNDHLVFKVAPQGQVFARDKYDYPVIIGGQFGKGKVVFNGCYYRKIKQNSTETVFLESLINWFFTKK
jgi:hypothetical protein